MTSTVFSVYNSRFGIGNDVSTICIAEEKEALVAKQLTIEEVQMKFLRWGEGGVQDAVLRNEFANVPNEELQAILEAGMLGDDHWLRQENDQWFLVDFAGMNRMCALRTAQMLIANKLLPMSQKPKAEDLDSFTTDELWRLADLYEFTIACFMDAMHQDPSHEVNRPYRELNVRFKALETNNAKLLQEKQQAVADLGKANGEVARLQGELAKKPVPVDATTVSPEDLAVIDKAKALVVIRPDLTPEILKQILGENEERDGLVSERDSWKQKATRRFRLIVLIAVVFACVAGWCSRANIKIPQIGGKTDLQLMLERLKEAETKQ